MTLFKKWPRITITTTAIVLLAIGVAGGMAISSASKTLCVNKLTFINSDVMCGKPAVIGKAGYAKTQDEIQTFIEAERSAGRVSDVSVYFRDLENGPTFSIDENADFTPASLLKLPLAVFYMVMVEKDPELLDQKLAFSSTQETFTQTFSPSEEIVVNHSYTVEELLMHMLVYSDNSAYELLWAHLEKSGLDKLIQETFLELGLISSGDAYNESLTVGRYASIFRGLYNASYVNPELSNKVLGWLTQSKFTLGLDGGVPEGVKIAHKFGERSFPNGTNQLHDCGIVYYPDNPYLLCVMTRGNNYDELASVIRTISKDVYEEVNSRRIN